MGVIFRNDRQPPVTGSGLRRAQPAPYNKDRAITASAKKLGKTELSMYADNPQPYTEWQKDAWVGYDRIGEIHYGFNLLANTFSRVRVHGAAIVNINEPPVDLKTAREGSKVNSELARIVEELMADFVRTDFSSHARNFALSLCVAGECLLLEVPDESSSSADGAQRTSWVIKSTDEVKIERDKIRIVPRAGANSGAAGERVLSVRQGGAWSPMVNIGRIWRQHPRYTTEPDSSMKALSDSIEELLLLSRLVRNASRSRLNAGMLFMPDGITVVGGTEAPMEPALDLDGNPVNEPAVDDGNAFLSDLIDSMVTPIEDETATSSIVPLVITGAGEMGEQIKHITFERKSDEWLAGRADRALERILQGIDMPKELVSGLANVKYSNALVITDNLYKTHVEPLALMFVDALTDIYLRPMLLARGVAPEDADRVCVWYDPSEIVTRPDQSDNASEGYDRFLLSGDAWRRSHGFSDLDAPTEQQLAIQLLLAKGSLPEDVTAALLAVALPKVMQESRDENLQNREVEFPATASDLLDGGDGAVDNGDAQQDNDGDTQTTDASEVPA